MHQSSLNSDAPGGQNLHFSSSTRPVQDLITSVILHAVLSEEGVVPRLILLEIIYLSKEAQLIKDLHDHARQLVISSSTSHNVLCEHSCDLSI
jgi:hypothetical protein